MNVCNLHIVKSCYDDMFTAPIDPFHRGVVDDLLDIKKGPLKGLSHENLGRYCYISIESTFQGWGHMTYRYRIGKLPSF